MDLHRLEAGPHPEVIKMKHKEAIKSDIINKHLNSLVEQDKIDEEKEQLDQHLILKMSLPEKEYLLEEIDMIGYDVRSTSRIAGMYEV